MASKQAHKRLTREYKLIVENPPQFIEARPNEDNILEWHYILLGPPDTPYDGGQYHGTLTFTSEYPFKPPAIRMITPLGRFKTNSRLCLSMSDYHPDQWNPAWSVATILTGMLSFMTGNESTTGSIATSDAHKKQLAVESKVWNVAENSRFVKHFPEVVEANKRELAAPPKKKPLLREEANQMDLARLEAETVVENATLLDPEDRARAMATKVVTTRNGGRSVFVYCAVAAIVVALVKQVIMK
ncbi:hypothetical protein BABINDRAFT_41045 [Babjeviella inositovora NRRL Y-12698]|uniref:Ubiquitin-conjugating enzyme E2 6 n=1 Tax=Babjeviella inositovora NRRL Y-12698 TaxID=984486 RepID=A0A1E3QJ53_9ASCO|nr:uncharacterized protein BABINDRAFT_41045 [Babjeviella inositovora NRRL Y-12698]ODQ77725.1 hypothetical protein BABINDRAFT_41045 [Babjeviella inositovora NRRL Y-12698]